MPEFPSEFLRPTQIERIFGRILKSLIWIGLVRGHFFVLEVIGRRSFKTISLPVDPLDLDGRLYLVCARGDSNWVRNVRASSQVALARTLTRRLYIAYELPVERRPRVLKAYLDRYAREVQRFFPVPKGSPEAAFNDLAPRYPVFELRPAYGSVAEGGMPRDEPGDTIR